MVWRLGMTEIDVVYETRGSVSSHFQTSRRDSRESVKIRRVAEYF